MSRKPDIARLKAAKDEKKLAKALEYSSDLSVRLEAAEALGTVGKITALKHLVALMGRVEEADEVRAEAAAAVGKICAWAMSSHEQISVESLSGSELRRHKDEISEVYRARKGLRLLIEEGSSPLSSAAAGACMSLPLDSESAMMTAFNSEGGENRQSVFSNPRQDSSEVTNSVKDTGAETAEQVDSASVPEEMIEIQKDKITGTESVSVPEETVETYKNKEIETDSASVSKKTVETQDRKAVETDKKEIEMREPDLDKPVEIAPGIYWVGRREDTLLERNIYLRVFTNGDKTVNLLIDPGPPEDLTPLVKKLSSLIGGIRNLHVMFLNHQDPDVSYNSGHLQKLNPNCIVLCSEDSWRLVKFYGLDPKKYKAVESFKDMKVTLSTGHTLRFIPTPYCHFRGAVMLFDEETGVLFSGDFLGGLSFKQDLYASPESWDGIATFHQIYMPSQAALKHAVNNIREMGKAPGIIAPQHGSILTGELVQDFLGRVENLEVGLDLFLKDHTKKNYIAALNELLAEFSQIVDSSIIPRALSAFMSDGSFPNAITVGDSGVTDIKVDAQYAVEIFLRELRQQTPSDLLDLVDISIVRVLTMWKIPLPEFMLVKSSQQESVFEDM
ncbi:MAG: hypothetical protein J7K88_05175 [Candidatus Fermentibacteraceae bacterium]|nr:hypothetical protein [Candidatus Fermentibacteraceae bacterium]